VALRPAWHGEGDEEGALKVACTPCTSTSRCAATA
jgi:hypothetical protein